MMPAANSELRPGDRVNWSASHAPTAGYAISATIPGILRRVYGKSLLIELRVPAPFDAKRLLPILKRVPAADVSPRLVANADFGETDLGG